MTDLKEGGRVASQPGSCPTGQAAARLDASRFDPSRIAEGLTDKQRQAVRNARDLYHYRGIDLGVSTGVLMHLCRATSARPALFRKVSVYADPPGSIFPQEYDGGTLTRAGMMVQRAIRDSDTRRMAETGTGSVRSTSSAGGAAASPSTNLDQSHDG